MKPVKLPSTEFGEKVIKAYYDVPIEVERLGEIQYGLQRYSGTDIINNYISYFAINGQYCGV
jgi:hypothetical protein